MATQQSMDTVQKAYIGYYGRPADPAGLEYWADRLENEENGDLSALIDAFGNSAEYTSRYEGQSNAELVNNLYQQLFNRDAEEEGLNFYVGKLESGEYSLGDIAIVVMNGAQNSDVTALENKLAAANDFTKAVTDADATYGENQIDEAVEFIGSVDADNPADEHAAENVVVHFPKPNDEPVVDFNLEETTEEVTVTTAASTDTVIYWGYNPHAHGETDVDNMDGNDPSGNDNNLTNEGPADGGVVLADLLTQLAGTGLFDLSEVFPDMFGDIDVANPTDFPFANVTDLTIGAGADGTSTVTVQTDAGEVAQAEVELAQSVLDYMDNLLFDEEGNSRLYEVVVETPASTVTTDVATRIVLTPQENNGGTEENGFTGDADNTITAGRLDLLHNAYIDGGTGNNTLEVDAKGFFAQPDTLVNIQTVNITNMANVYTDSDGNSIYPDLSAGFIAESHLDLNHATDLEQLTITESDSGMTYDHDSDVLTDEISLLGSLTVSGIRADATVTLEGGFTQDINVSFGQGLTDGVNLVLNLGEVSATAKLSVMHDSETLNIDSTGGGNTLHAASLGDSSLMNLNVSGTAKLYIDGDIGGSFAAGHPATINASENTAGVDLQVGAADADLSDGNDDAYADEIVFVGTAESDDHFTAYSGKSVDIVSGNGDNEFVANTQGSEALGEITIVSGDGDNEVTATADHAEGDITIALGDGDNHVDATNSTPNATVGVAVGEGDNTISAVGDTAVVLAGDGDNTVTTDTSDTVGVELGNGDNTVSAEEAEVVVIAAGDGENTITATADTSIAISTGAGDDTVTIAGLGTNYGVDYADDALINIDLGAGNNTLVIGDASNGLSALEGSTITGSDITLKVLENDANLCQAEITGVTGIVLNDSITLTLSVSQLAAIGTENISVVNEKFGQTANLHLVVDEDTVLGDLLVLSELTKAVNLTLEVNDGVQLSLTAEELHKYFENEGITAGETNNNDEAPGTVVITDAGLEFEYNDAASSGGSVSGDFDGSNVTVIGSLNGYNRPTDTDGVVVLNIDSTEENGAISGFSTTLYNYVVIEGVVDLAVDGTVSLGSDYTIDFSELQGNLTGLTLADFDEVTEVMGNNTNTRIDVELGGDVATADEGLVSSGVATYVVTEIDDEANDDGDVDSLTATFYTCETTQDLEVLGLQGNYDSTITFANTERGVEFLMEVDYAKSDGYVVGTLIGEFAREDADAVVNVVGLQDLPAGETQMVAGIELVNADTATINVEGGNTEITSLVGADLESLTLASDANLEIVTVLPTNVASVDASGVTGSLTVELDAPTAEGITFVGAAGETTLTLDDTGVDAIDSIEGAGGVALVIDGTVDLTEAALTDVTTVTLLDGADLTVTMEQADAIGAANFMIDEADAANLTLQGLNDQQFAVADYADELTLSVTLAAEETVTLHADTDLTDIASLEIPEGTTLVLTAEQFQQLNGVGVLTGDGSVHITGLTQDAVGENGEDLDLSGIALGADSTVTITLAEDVNLSEAALAGAIDTVNIGDNLSLTLGEVADADGVDFVGGADSGLIFTDTDVDAGDYIDASGFGVSYVELTNVLVSGENVDQILGGLPGDVTKIITDDYGHAATIDQTATVEAITIVDGAISFNTLADDTEIANFTLNLEGGSQIGGLNLDTTPKFVESGDLAGYDAADADLQRELLKTLTINSDGVDLNPVTDTTDNVIDGDISPLTTGGTNTDNNLLDVTINASQALVVNGDIIFNSVTGDDDFVVNDDDEAVATLTINGTADVTLGGLDTSDADVDGLNVENAGTGILSIDLDGANLQSDADGPGGNDPEDDALSFTGSNIELNIVGDLDLSDDVITGVSSIDLDDGVTLTLSQAQFNTLTTANLSVIDSDTDAGNLVLVDFDPTVEFNAAGLDEDITLTSIELSAGGTLNPLTDLTDVGEIIVPEGETLILTADQFAQLDGNGTITGVDADGNVSTDFSVTITGLNQEDADAGFSLADVDSTNITVQVEGDVTLESSADPAVASDLDVVADLTIELEDGATLGLVNIDQLSPTTTLPANSVEGTGLTVTGGDGTAVELQFVNGALVDNTFDASGLSVDSLRVLNELVDGRDVELFQNLDGTVTVVIFEDDTIDAGFLDNYDRDVVVEAGVTVADWLVFNDVQEDQEVLNL